MEEKLTLLISQLESLLAKAEMKPIRVRPARQGITILRTVVTLARHLGQIDVLTATQTRRDCIKHDLIDYYKLDK